MLRLTTFLSFSLLTALSFAPPAFAFKSENLLVAVPKGYKPDDRCKSARGLLIPGEGLWSGLRGPGFTVCFPFGVIKSPCSRVSLLSFSPLPQRCHRPAPPISAASSKRRGRLSAIVALP